MRVVHGEKGRITMKYIGLITLLIFSIWVMYAIVSTIVLRKCSTKVIRKLIEKDGILLTFDDGPHPEYTVKLLKLLKKHNVRAVFFVVGELVDKYPNIIKQMHAEGHMIGIHHYKHLSNWRLLPHQTKRQINKTKQSIEKIIGENVVLYRPPWGHFNLATLLNVGELQTVMWSHIYKDWKSRNHHLENLLTNLPEGGSILLLHDNGDTKGADETAPLEMMSYLKRYLVKMEKEKRTFAEPRVLFKGKEGQQL